MQLWLTLYGSLQIRLQFLLFMHPLSYTGLKLAASDYTTIEIALIVRQSQYNPGQY